MSNDDVLNILIVSYYNKKLIDTCLNSLIISTKNAHIYIIDNSTSLENKMNEETCFPNVTIIDNYNKKLFDVREIFDVEGAIGSIEHAYSVQYFIDTYNVPFILLDSDTIVKKDLHEFISDANLLAIGNLSTDLHPRITPACVYLNAPEITKNKLKFLDINRIKPKNILYSTGASFFEDLLTNLLLDKVMLDADIALYIEHLWGGSQNDALSGHYVSKDLSFIDWDDTLTKQQARKKGYYKFDYTKYVADFFKRNAKYYNIILSNNSHRALDNILRGVKCKKDINITAKTTVLDMLKDSFGISEEILFIIFQLYIYTEVFKLIYERDNYSRQNFEEVNSVYDFIHLIFKDNSTFNEVCYFLRNWLKSNYDNSVRDYLLNNYNINLDRAIKDYHNNVINSNFTAIIKKFATLYFLKLKTFKARRLKCIIGSGWEGVVFELGHGVIKLYFRKICSLNSDFLTNKYLKHFPKIYHYSKYFLCEEKVKVKTPKCRKYVSLLSYYPEESTGSYYKIIRKDRSFYKNCKLSQEEKDILQWGTELFDINLRKKHHNNFYDINIDNIGERENGDIVLFDP